MQAEKMWLEAVINKSLYLTSPRIRGRKKYFSDFSNVNYDAAKCFLKHCKLLILIQPVPYLFVF